MPKKVTTNTNATLIVSLAVTRVLLGFVFLWAFFDKMLGLGYATPEARAWINGGSPTTGFLKNVDGIFAEFFNALAGNPLVDWLFMLGLLGVGVGLILGIAMRLSIISGAAMLFLMWLAALPLDNNPLIDDHIVYIAVLVVLWTALPLQRLSLGHNWRALPFVESNPWLK